jgi:hypothetical protein
LTVVSTYTDLFGEGPARDGHQNSTLRPRSPRWAAAATKGRTAAGTAKTDLHSAEETTLKWQPC